MTELLEPGGIARRTVLRLALPSAGGFFWSHARRGSGRRTGKVTIDNFAFTPATVTVPKGAP